MMIRRINNTTINAKPEPYPPPATVPLITTPPITFSTTIYVVLFINVMDKRLSLVKEIEKDAILIFLKH
jgi:hypothetical protein